MAYYRTLKIGERRLIYTARDRATQSERRKGRYSLPIPDWTAIHPEPGDSWIVEATDRRGDVEHFWWWNDYDRQTMLDAIANQRQRVEDSQRRNLLTLKRERGRIPNEAAWSGQATITLNGEARRCEASPGYLAYDRLTLEYHRAKLRGMETALRVWDRQEWLRCLGGKPFRAPYSRF